MRQCPTSNHRAILSLLALSTMFICSSSAEEPVGLPQEIVERIERVITTEMSRANIPGLSVAVVSDFKERWANGYGMADLENFVPAKASTSYRIASIAKPMISTAIMQLVEKGKIDLDAPVQTYVPAFPQKQWRITTRHLLNNVSGVRAYQGDEWDSTKHYTNVTSTLDVFKNDPLVHEPGTKYSYSSYNFVLLQAVLEGASGMTYPDYMREHIFKPAGMEHTSLDDVFAIIPNRARGYRKLENGDVVNSNLADTSNKGALCGTVGDLAKFAIAYLTGKLVKTETIEDMFTVHPVSKRQARSGGEIAYAKGWNTLIHDGEKEVYHAGNQHRVTGLLYIRPRFNIVVIMLCNLELAPITVRMARQISDIVLGKGRTNR